MKKHIGIRLVTAAAAFALGAYSAQAADSVSSSNNVNSFAGLGQAQSPWQVRVRALGVVPRDKGSVHGVAGSDMNFSDTVIPEFDITYYMTDNLAAELILGTTYSRISGAGSLGSLGKIGKTWLLPPTLTLQYHFTGFGNFKPYIGAGVNYTIFYNESGNHRATGLGRISHLDIDNTWGGAVQVGFDYMLDSHWGINMDVKKLYLRPDFEARLDGSRISGKAKLDPWLIGAGITYRF